MLEAGIQMVSADLTRRIDTPLCQMTQVEFGLAGFSDSDISAKGPKSDAGCCRDLCILLFHIHVQ